MIEFNRAQLGQAAKQYGFVRDTVIVWMRCCFNTRMPEEIVTT